MLAMRASYVASVRLFMVRVPRKNLRGLSSSTKILEGCEEIRAVSR
jgi:hypothetical protein